jgi:hypothetical protein
LEFYLVWGVLYFGFFEFIFLGCFIQEIYREIKYKEDNFDVGGMLVSMFLGFPLAYCICELITIFKG